MSGEREAFCAYTMKHPHLSRAERELNRAIRSPGDSNVILVFGPTGVGKSTLATHVLRALSAERAGRSDLPVLGVTAPAPSTAVFSSKDFFLRTLDAMKEPGVDAKVFYGPPGVDGEILEARRQRVSEAAARRSFESALVHRGVQVLLVDEAQHMCVVGGASRTLAQLEQIKSLADSTGALFVLVGTYRLLDFLNLNGQLARRCAQVHFSRYDLRVPSDADAFRKLVLALGRELPLPVADLEPLLEELYEGCLGCVGVLKGVLWRALVRVLDEHGTRITRKDLRAVVLPADARREMAQEIHDGERRLAGRRDDERRIRAFLGLPARAGDRSAPASGEAAARVPKGGPRLAAVSDPAELEDAIAQVVADNETPERAPITLAGAAGVSRRGARPFERKPSRDPVGPDVAERSA